MDAVKVFCEGYAKGVIESLGDASDVDIWTFYDGFAINLSGCEHAQMVESDMALAVSVYEAGKGYDKLADLPPTPLLRFAVEI